jgi:hypothetical protein
MAKTKNTGREARKAAKTGPRTVTSRPGDGRIITREVDETRDNTFNAITDRLWRARAQLNCVQRAIHFCDPVSTDDDVGMADIALAALLRELTSVHDDLGSFQATHLSKVRVREARS